jgi:hypothetical protein
LFGPASGLELRVDAPDEPPLEPELLPVGELDEPPLDVPLPLLVVSLPLVEG